MFGNFVRGRIHEALCNIMRSVAPLTHFIPMATRRRAVQRIEMWMRRNLERSSYPTSWEPGKYPFGVNFYGHLCAHIGLGRGARLYAKAIGQLPFQKCMIDLPLPDRSDFARDELDFPLRRSPRFEVNVIHINPDHLPYEFGRTPARFWKGRYNIGVWLWELEDLPEPWIKWLDSFDEFWTPSSFIAGTIRKYTDKPVCVIPYGIEVEKAKYDRAYFGLNKDDFVVLAMYDSQSYAERKNPYGAIEAFVRAFGAEHPNAKLVLKMNNPNDGEIQNIRHAVSDSNVLLISKRMQRDEVTSLIAAADVFVSLHRSEGFGLTVTEAMSQHVPVVTTAYSATADFVNESCGCPVGYTLVDVRDRYIYSQAGTQWAEPDVDEAARYLKRLYAEARFRHEIGEKGYDRIAGEFSVRNCSQLMRERLEKIQQMSIGKQGKK